MIVVAFFCKQDFRFICLGLIHKKFPVKIMFAKNVFVIFLESSFELIQMR